MNRDDIIRMAREAGFESHDAIINYPKELQRFANLVAASEREACAELIPPQYFELRDLIRARREQ